jgi:iron complex outermembrane receptor protein
MTDQDRSGVLPAKCRACAVALALGALAGASTAAAQDTTKVVTIRSLTIEVPRPIATTGGTSAVEISLDSIGAVAAPTMEEFLRRMPTVQIRANSRGEAQPDLRGAEDRQIAIFLDNVPLTLGWDHRTDISVIPLTAVRKLTLYRGLSSMLHGPNVLGGAIEFDVSRGTSVDTSVRPFLGSVSVDQEGGASMAGTAGASVEHDAGTWVLRGGAGYRNSPGVTLPAGTQDDRRLSDALLRDTHNRRLNSDRRLADGFVAARFHGTGGAWLSSLVTVSDAERGVPPEAHVGDPRLWRYPEQSRQFMTVSGGTGMRETGPGRGELEASFGLDRSTTRIDEYASPAYRTVVDGETGATTTLTGRLLGDYDFEHGPEVWTALTVASVSHREDLMAGHSFDYQQRLWSLGGEVELGSEDILRSDVGATRWTVGASLDGSDTPLSGDKQPVGTLWAWGVRAGVSRAAAGGNVLMHAGFSRRTRFPSLRELYSGALGRFRPNPDLRPESLKAGEAGITVTDGADTELQIVGFVHRLTDGIVRVSTVTPGGAKFQRVNRDQVRSSGIEALVRGSLGALTYGGSFTLQRVRIRDPAALGRDELAEYAPALSGTANLGAVGPGDVALTGFFRVRGVQYCQNFEVAGLDRMDASATVDLEARRALYRRAGGSGWSLEGTVGVSNLTDSTVLDQCGLPQPGRTFRIQFNIR